MFSGLTAKAQKVINQYAQEEAKNFNSDKIQPEHIFLGLLRENESIAVKVLQKLNIDVEKIKYEVSNILKSSTNTLLLGEIQPSDRVQKILTLSAEEAKVLGHHYIGTEHLLLGIYREESTIYNTLESRNVNLSQLRRITVNILGFGMLPKGEFFNDEKVVKTPTTDNFSRDLTKLAQEDQLDPVIGRKKEINRLIQILSRRTKNNPILIGEPGVGKSAIVEGLATKIFKKETPYLLFNKRVVVLDLAACVAGTKYRGEFEERFKNIMLEIKRAKDIILFIDEVHTLIGAGGAEGAMDAANILKPSLSRGELQCIGSTTLKEYKRYIERDTALVRRFQKITVEEPSVSTTIEILKGLKEKYESYHNVKYPLETIEATVKFAKRYLTEKFLPDTAIDILDEVGAKARLLNCNRPNYLKEMELEIEQLTKEKTNVVKNQEFEKAAIVRDKIQSKKEALKETLDTWEKSKKSKAFKITPANIAETISEITKIPTIYLEKEEKKRLINMEKNLQKELIGQNEAIENISKIFRSSRSGIRSNKKPAGSFIFLGPTGVGKTKLAKILAQFIFGSEDALIRIDMSEFMEKHNASRLIGSPPGYVGYEEGGELTGKIRQNPYCVILFDEIEKAHSEIFNMLLQVLEDGYLNDQLGHKVDFTNTIIIMTSNLGGKEMIHGSSLGFQPHSYSKEGQTYYKKVAMAELKKKFNPEFINRIDDIIIFNPLSEKEVIKVLDIFLDELKLNLKDQKIQLQIDQNVKEYLVKKGYNKQYGARPLRRAIQAEVEDKLASYLLEEKIKPGQTFKLSLKNNKTINVEILKPETQETPKKKKKTNENKLT